MGVRCIWCANGAVCKHGPPAGSTLGHLQTVTCAELAISIPASCSSPNGQSTFLKQNRVTELPIVPTFQGSCHTQNKGPALDRDLGGPGDLALPALLTLPLCVSHQSPIFLYPVSRMGSCHRAFAPVVSSGWTLYESRSFSFVGLSSEVVFSTRQPVTTPPSHLIDFLSGTHQCEVTLFLYHVSLPTRT